MDYSVMVRCLGTRDNIENYFAFLERMKDAGIFGVNLSFSEIQGLLNDDFDLDGFAERFLGCGMTARFAHAPMFYPFVFDRTDGKKWEKPIRIGLKLAAKCGVTDYVIHPGTVVDEDRRYLPEASLERNRSYLRPYVELGAKLGVRIALENGVCQPWDEKPPILRDVSPGFEELIALTDGFNEAYGKEVCGICFDFGHAHLAHCDIPSEIHRVGRRLRVTHIHDNDGAWDQHRPIGEGSIDWQGAVKALKDIGYDGELSLELYYDGISAFQRNPAAYLRKVYSSLTKLGGGGMNDAV